MNEFEFSELPLEIQTRLFTEGNQYRVSKTTYEGMEPERKSNCMRPITKREIELVFNNENYFPVLIGDYFPTLYDYISETENYRARFNIRVYTSPGRISIQKQNLIPFSRNMDTKYGKDKKSISEVNFTIKNLNNQLIPSAAELVVINRGTLCQLHAKDVIRGYFIDTFDELINDGRKMHYLFTWLIVCIIDIDGYETLDNINGIIKNMSPTDRNNIEYLFNGSDMPDYINYFYKYLMNRLR